MAGNSGYLPRNGKLPHDAQAVIHTRNPVPPQGDEREKVVYEYLAAGMVAMSEEMRKLARQIENRSRLVDEYQTQGSISANETTVPLQPTYDFMPEKIESIIVVGPPGNVTLTLGDRVWPLTIPAAGFLVIAPVAILLGRNDLRQLTGPAGNYNLELMGIADERFDA